MKIVWIILIILAVILTWFFLLKNRPINYVEPETQETELSNPLRQDLPVYPDGKG